MEVTNAFGNYIKPVTIDQLNNIFLKIIVTILNILQHIFYPLVTIFVLCALILLIAGTMSEKARKTAVSMLITSVIVTILYIASPYILGAIMSSVNTVTK